MTTSTTFKKAIASVAAILVLLCLLTAFAACIDPEQPDGDVFADGASMTLAIAEEPTRTIEVDLSGLDKNISLLDVFDKEEIDYVAESGMLYKVGSLAPTAPEYIYLHALQGRFACADRARVHLPLHFRHGGLRRVAICDDDRL